MERMVSQILWAASPPRTSPSSLAIGLPFESSPANEPPPNFTWNTFGRLRSARISFKTNVWLQSIGTLGVTSFASRSISSRVSSNNVASCGRRTSPPFKILDNLGDEIPVRTDSALWGQRLRTNVPLILSMSEDIGFLPLEFWSEKRTHPDGMRQ